MSKPVPAAPALSSKPGAPDASPSVLTDEMDGALCALSLYLSTADQVSRAPDIDRDRLRHALQGAREQLGVLVGKVDAACRANC